MALGDDFTSALDASNNQLTQTPGLAVDAATSGDPAQAGLLLSHTAQVQAAADAANNDQQQNSGGGILGHLWHDVTSAPGVSSVAHAIGTGASWLAKPLQQVQAEYRYIHEVYARQGFIPGFLTTLGVAGGAVIGGAVGGPTGAMLGAELAGGVEKGLARGGALGADQQTDAQLADSSSLKVSPGRDFSNLLGQIPGLQSLQNTNKGWGKVISGAGDAGFDLSMDPMMKAGVVYKDLKYGSDIALKEGSKVRGWLSDITGGAPGLTARSPEAADQLYHSGYWGGGYRRALGQIAGMNAGDITARFGGQLDGLSADTTLASGHVVKGLASSTTSEEVHRVFKRALSDEEMATRMFSGTLPSRSIMRSGGGQVADWVRNLDPQGAVSDQRSLLLPSKTGPGVKGLQAPAALSAPVKALTGDLAGAKQDVAGAVARKVRTLSGYLPYAMDKDTLALSRRTFDPMNPDALQGVYRSMRFSMGEQDARLWTDRFAQAQSLGDKKRIWAEANMEMLKAAGLPDDPQLLEHVTRGTRQIHMGPASESYGVGLNSGADVSKVGLPNGSMDDMALWSDQKGQFSFPDFFKVKQAVRDMHGYTSGKYGSMDDFVANSYTNKIFKPLALMNAGFGLRVAFSEGIPAALRYGLLNQLTAKVTTSAAKVNYQLGAPDRLTGQADSLMARAEAAKVAGNAAGAARYTQQAQDIYTKASTKVEHYHVLSAMQKLMGGAQNLLGATDEERDLAARIVMANEGHIVKGVADTAHGNSSFYLPDDPNLRSDAVIHYGKQWMGQRGLAPTGNFGPIAHDSNHFLESWKQELQKRSQNEQAQNVAKDLLAAHAAGKPLDEAAQQALDAESARIRDPLAYKYDKKVLGRYSVQSPEEIAADRVDAMQGLLVGQDGTFHADVAQMIADGQKPTLADLEHIDPTKLPKQVPGEIYEPWNGNGRIDALVSMGFKRLVDPVINKLSREPTYYNAVKQEWNNLAYLRANGLDDDAALRIAQYRGSHAMLPQIHNTELRTQFHALARNYLPFFFAQQQAVQRAAIVMAQNPNAVRGLQLVAHGLNDPGFVQNDGSGNRYLMVPALGEFGKAFQSGAAALGMPLVGGLPVSMSGSMESLKTVLPEMQMPGVAPLVSIPMNAFSSLSDQVHAPWAGSFDAVTKDILGDRGYGSGFFDSIMPNQFIRNTIMAASPDEQSRSFSNAMASAIASAYYHGDVPKDIETNPSAKQAFLDRITNNARSLFMMKALVGLVSPLSPQVSQEDPGFRDEFYKLVKTQGYSKAIDLFIREHGSKSISYTVAHTASNIGASLPYTQKAMDWINANNGLIHGGLGVGAAFLVPQDPSGGDAQKLSNEYLKMNLRERRTPSDFLDAIYIAAGNSAIGALKDRYDAALKASQGDSAKTAALRSAWADHIASMKAFHPVWADSYDSPKRTDFAGRAYEQLQVLFATGKAPQGEQTSAVATLMDAYQAYVNQMAGLATQRNQLANQSRQELKDQWSSFLDGQMKTNPRLAPVIRSVFSNLPDTPAAASRLDTGTQALMSGQVAPLNLSVAG